MKAKRDVSKGWIGQLAIVASLFAGAWALEACDAQAGDSKYGAQMRQGGKIGGQMAHPPRATTITPNTMGGYEVRQGSRNLGTLKPTYNGGYRFDESYQERNPLRIPSIK